MNLVLLFLEKILVIFSTLAGAGLCCIIPFLAMREKYREIDQEFTDYDDENDDIE